MLRAMKKVRLLLLPPLVYFLWILYFFSFDPLAVMNPAPKVVDEPTVSLSIDSIQKELSQAVEENKQKSEKILSLLQQQHDRPSSLVVTLTAEELSDKRKKDTINHLRKQELIQLAIQRSSSAEKQQQKVGNQTIINPFDFDSKFAPRDEWFDNTQNSNTVFPNIDIVGFPKSGTSQLYNILSNRIDAKRFHPTNKEYCSHASQGKSNQEIKEKLFYWHKQLYDETNKSNNQVNNNNNALEEKKLVTINGCIDIDDAIIRHQYLKPTNQKFIVLFRDPAEWMWAAWNFWTDKNIDQVLGLPENWATPESNYRSPELFHEIFLAGPTKLIQFAQKFGPFRRLSDKKVQLLRTVVGEENVLMMRSEDMKPDVVNSTGGFLDKLSNFTGLDRSLYGDDIFSISNCNSKKGARENCGNTASSAYKITGDREMLHETRELVYIYFWEECKMWARDFGIEYAACVHVIQ